MDSRSWRRSSRSSSPIICKQSAWIVLITGKFVIPSERMSRARMSCSKLLGNDPVKCDNQHLSAVGRKTVRMDDSFNSPHKDQMSSPYLAPPQHVLSGASALISGRTWSSSDTDVPGFTITVHGMSLSALHIVLREVVMWPCWAESVASRSIRIMSASIT